MLDKQIVLNNLKALKRSVKLWPEMARVAGGIATRSLNRSHVANPLNVQTKTEFRPYRQDGSPHRIDVITPPGRHFMTTFFDVDPASPSGRYLAVTEVPFIWRIPHPGDTARVGIIDMVDGLYRSVSETRGWGSQLGANVQWGDTDQTLYYNDVINGRGTGVALDLPSGEARPLGGPIYGLDPERRYSYSGDIRLINAGIPGYGIPQPLWSMPRPAQPLDANQGVWKIDLHSGSTHLLLSIREIIGALPPEGTQRNGEHYVFNVKVSPDNQRLLIVMFARRVPGRGGWPVQLVTCRIDGSDIKLALPDSLWRVGGHHPNWTADGQYIVMNLKPKGKEMQFVRFRPDGSELTCIAPGHKGSGHPSLDRSGRWLLTDAYVNDGFIDSQGEVPLRLIDLNTNDNCEITRVFTNKINGPRRVDPHPVWASDGNVYFNGIMDGYRQIFRASFADSLDQA